MAGQRDRAGAADAVPSGPALANHVGDGLHAVPVGLGHGSVGNAVTSPTSETPPALSSSMTDTSSR